MNFLLSSIIALALLSASVSAVELLKNGNFEAGKIPWNFAFEEGTGASVEISSSECRLGQCVKIVLNNAERANANQHASSSLVAGKLYSLNAWAKTAEGAKIRVGISDYSWRDSTCKRIGKFFYTDYDGTGAWLQASHQLKIPMQDGCGTINSTHKWIVYLYAVKPNDANAPVYFDDVSFASGELTGRDSGIYGPTPWKKTGSDPGPAEFYLRTSPMTFTIRTSINANKDILENETKLAKLDGYIENLKAEIGSGKLMTPQRRILLRVYFWNSQSEQIGVDTQLSDISEYQASVNYILGKIGDKVDDLYGITLGEENWVAANPNIAKVLDGLYKGTKASYPSLQIYQWYDYRLTARNPVPDFYGGVFPAADGWIVEELRLANNTCPHSRCNAGNDPYRLILQKYLITGKPVITEIWAATARPDQFNETSFPNVQPYPENMFGLMEHQFNTNLEFNLPTAFYWYACPKGNVAPCIPPALYHTPFFRMEHPAYFPSQEDYDLQVQMNAKVLRLMERARNLPVGYSGFDSQQLWSSEAIPLPCTNGAPSYNDGFWRNTLVNSTNGTGFRSLVWSPNNLSVRSFEGKPVNATITYHFKCAAPVSQATAWANITINTRGTVSLEISKDGTSWWKAASGQSGEFSVDLGGQAQRKDVYLRVRLESTDTTPGILPITLKRIRIGPKTQAPGAPPFFDDRPGDEDGFVAEEKKESDHDFTDKPQEDFIDLPSVPAAADEEIDFPAIAPSPTIDEPVSAISPSPSLRPIKRIPTPFPEEKSYIEKIFESSQLNNAVNRWTGWIRDWFLPR